MIEHYVDWIKFYGSIQVPGDQVSALEDELNCLNISYSLQFDQVTNFWIVERR